MLCAAFHFLSFHDFLFFNFSYFHFLFFRVFCFVLLSNVIIFICEFVFYFCLCLLCSCACGCFVFGIIFIVVRKVEEGGGGGGEWRRQEGTQQEICGVLYADIKNALKAQWSVISLCLCTRYQSVAGATKERGEWGERGGAQWATVAKDKRLFQLLCSVWSALWANFKSSICEASSSSLRQIELTARLPLVAHALPSRWTRIPAAWHAQQWPALCKKKGAIDKWSVEKCSSNKYN